MPDAGAHDEGTDDGQRRHRHGRGSDVVGAADPAPPGSDSQVNPDDRSNRQSEISGGCC
jgi:hypothetical protein